MLYILRGTTCSGKDALANKFFPKNTVVSSDYFRELLTGDVASQRRNQEVFSMLNRVVESRLEHRVNITVYNATNLRMKDCSNVIELCKKWHTPYTILSLQPPSKEELFERSKKRGLGGGLFVPMDIIDKHYERYYNINTTENFEQEAINSPLCEFVEIGQDYEVIKYIK